MPKVQVHLSREVLVAGQDLRTFMDLVYRAVNEDFSLFEGEDKWDVWAEEIHPNRVIVRTYSTGEYRIADMGMSDGEITLSNVKKVHRQWVVEDDDGEREVFESGDTSVVAREVECPSFWGSVV